MGIITSPLVGSFLIVDAVDDLDCVKNMIDAADLWIAKWGWVYQYDRFTGL